MQYSKYGLIASLMLVTLALACYTVVLVLARSVRPEPVMAHAGVGVRVGAGASDGFDADASADGAETPDSTATGKPRALALYGTSFTRLALVFLTACLFFLTVGTGHGPFTNQYEFSVSFAWGVLVAYVYFEHRYRVRTLGLLILPIAAAFLLYAMSIGATANPLVPALQNPPLLITHIAVAVVAYGAFSISFAAAVLYLIQPEEGKPGLPKPALLDEIGYRAVIIGYPLLTLTVVLGALWAEKAWGTYWSWDPKETASLFTWLIYGAYLHSRVARGWVGRRAAWLLVAGFASVLLCFFGNLFFGGLHSYGNNK
jgi:ABC-type transport system involved in cytochrome c biogenesis permease subunit